jgi:hypothetical protein
LKGKVQFTVLGEDLIIGRFLGWGRNVLLLECALAG